PRPPPKPDIVVIGHQWWWEARYASGAVTANEIHIPVGKPVALRLDAADVLHEFWVPELARKMTTVPGHPNHIWIQAENIRTYLGSCSEFCGTQHAWMHFLIVGEPREECQKWEQAQLVPAPAPASQSAQKGLALFEQMSCVNCHAIKATSASAQIGLDLMVPNNTLLGPDTYNWMFTMHGTTMIFLVAMPVLFGIMNYILPLQIGAHDMAFPRLNAFGVWLVPFGGILLHFSFLAGGP